METRTATAREPYVEPVLEVVPITTIDNLLSGSGDDWHYEGDD